MYCYRRPRRSPAAGFAPSRVVPTHTQCFIRTTPSSMPTGTACFQPIRSASCSLRGSPSCSASPLLTVSTSMQSVPSHWIVLAVSIPFQLVMKRGPAAQPRAAAISSLFGEQGGKQEPSQRPSHCQQEPTKWALRERRRRRSVIFRRGCPNSARHC